MKRERKPEAGSFIFQGVDLRREFENMLKLPVVRTYLWETPTLKVRHGKYTGCSGMANYTKKTVTVTIRGQATLARVLEVMLHEVVHFAAFKQHHNDVFIARLNRAAHEHWGIRVERLSEVKSAHRTLGAHRGRKAYQVDRLLTELLSGKFFRAASYKWLMRSA
jgi:hypothetical protein